MPLKSPKLRIVTPADQVPLSRGFYQLEEEQLYIPIEYPHQKVHFFSYLDSEVVSLQLDREGRLIFVEINLPRRRWKVRRNFVAPERAEAADIRFLDFRETIVSPSVFCDMRREKIMLKFSAGPAEANFFLSNNIIAQVDSSSRLVAVWASDFIDDLAGREIASWRRSLRSGEHTPASVI